MKNLIFIFFSIITTGCVSFHSMTGGQVLDNTSQVSINNAAIHLSKKDSIFLEITHSIITDSLGNFNFGSFNKYYKVKVSSPGYKTMKFKIRGDKNKILLKDRFSGTYVQEISTNKLKLKLNRNNTYTLKSFDKISNNDTYSEGIWESKQLGDLNAILICSTENKTDTLYFTINSDLVYNSKTSQKKNILYRN